MKSYFSSGIYFFILEAIVILHLWFKHMENQAFLSSILLAKACMICFLECFGRNLSFKKFDILP